jgi:hypothetical protein
MVVLVMQALVPVPVLRRFHLRLAAGEDCSEDDRDGRAS